MSLYPKFQLKKTNKSALKGFTTQYIIKPQQNSTYDPKSCLNAVKKTALVKFKPKTKV